MVIEREIGLRTYIESGVVLDAHISYDLLATIFRPSAPLHDGAVIIQKDRVAAAACFLPLSINPVLSTQLGTRHRAGIGITEESDAISVIVSEETGAISVAVGGQIERDITPEELRERLSILLHRHVPATTLPTTQDHDLENGNGAIHADSAHRFDGDRTMILWLRTHVFGHLRLKILSLLIALALWYAVAHDQPAEIALSVPIEFYNTPEHLEISSERIQRAEVRVQGPARILREMTNADIDAVIDLAGARVGEHTFDLTPKQIRHLPHNVADPAGCALRRSASNSTAAHRKSSMSRHASSAALRRAIALAMSRPTRRRSPSSARNRD